MGKWLITILVIWLYSINVSAGVFHDSNLDWQTIETGHFLIHFHQGEENVAREFVPVAEKTYVEISKFLNWYPKDKTHVVITDEYDVSNGYARVFPSNSIVIFLSAPDEANSLEDHNGWIELVFRHEFLHIVHLDKVRGLPDGFQSVFGRQPLLFPNSLQPRWLTEGLATYAETDIDQGVGRGQSSFFNMFMRIESLTNIKPVRRINQPIRSWPAGYTPYLYGVNFFNFVRDRYGEKKIVQLVEEYSDNLVPFRINSNSNMVLNGELPDLWILYNRYLKEKFKQPIEGITAAGIREGKSITNDGYQSGPLVLLDGKFYFVDFNGKTHTTIKVSDGSGSATSIMEVNRGSRLDLHKQQGVLITQPEICRNARYYYDIYRADIDGKHVTRLTNCARFRHAIWTSNGKQIFAVHNKLGINRLQRLDDKAALVEELWVGKEKQQIGRMDWSDTTGQLIASIWIKDKGWNLAIFDFEGKQWQLLTDDKFIQIDPSFSDDGKAIIYSSDEDGVYNVYRLELATREKSRLTNLLGGAFSPSMQAGKLAYVGYNRQGFDVYFMDDIKPDNTETLVLKKPKTARPEAEKQNVKNDTDTGQLTFDVTKLDKQPDVIKQNDLVARPYSALSNLAPTWWMPLLAIDDQRTEIGIVTTGRDVLDRHSYGIALAYDIKNSVALGGFDYLYDGFWPLINFGYSRETDLFIDSNDNPERVRVEDQIVLQTIFPFLSFDTDVFVHAALVKEQERDVWTNGVAALADTKEDLAGFAIRLNTTQRYPLSISRSEGRDVRAIYEDTDAWGNSDRKGQATIGDWREFIHFGSSEHVLALRLVEARGRNNPKPFRLGGIQDNDTLFSAIFAGESEPLFNKRSYTLRGYDEGHAALAGRNMRLFSAEYRFPVWRIEHGWMVPPFGFNQVYATVFYDVGGVWDTGTKPADYYSGAGFEINVDLDIFYNARVNVALGFATGFDDVLGEEKVYLRIGSQF